MSPGSGEGVVHDGQNLALGRQKLTLACLLANRRAPGTALGSLQPATLWPVPSPPHRPRARLELIHRPDTHPGLRPDLTGEWSCRVTLKHLPVLRQACGSK